LNEEQLQQIQFRLKKLKETNKAMENRVGKLDIRTMKRRLELAERAYTIRALLYEDFEALGDNLVWDGDDKGMEHRRKFVKLMTDIFKECRK
jgi:hypothetical protein